MSQATLLSPSASPAGGFPVNPAEITSPDDLLQHVSAAIVSCLGPQLPVFTALSIIRAFWERFPLADVIAICDQAFNVHRGIWRQAPVTPLRFLESHDSFFSLPLLEEARLSRPVSR